MLRPSILGLGAYTAVCVMAGSVSAEDINFHCSNGLDLHISSSDFSVNGEKREFDWVDANDTTLLSKKFPIPQTTPLMPTLGSGKDAALRLRWRVQANADASRRQAYFLLDLSKGRLDVIDGLRHEALHLRCTNLSRKLAV
jgi:hypothetical protein